MKKLIILFICCLILLCGCKKARPAGPNAGSGKSEDTVPVFEGTLDYGDLEDSQGATAGSTEPTRPADTPSAPAPTGPATEPTVPFTEPSVPTTEATEPSVPTTEATEPSAPATEPSTEVTEPSTTAPVFDQDGYFNQVVRP